MNNVLEFFVKMKDLMSTGLTKLATTSKEKFAAIQSNINATIVKNDALAASFQKVNKSASFGGMFGGLKSIVGVLGLTAVLGGVAEMAHAGIEKVHALHQAEAALTNTMQNMGIYSKEAFEQAGKGADELRKKTGLSKSSIIDLQSQLSLVGNIGATEMNRMIAVSADMAIKFHQGVNEAGNALAKAVNNPEMMRRLAMQLKIDPKIVEHIQKLAQHGKEAQARLELIAIAEQKVGGAAAAAFNADEAAQYNLVLENIQLKFGKVAETIKVAVLPYVIKFLEWFEDLGHWADRNKDLVSFIGNVAASIATVTVVVGLAALATKAWSFAVGLLNTVLYANPIVLVLTLIGSLIVYFYRVNNKTETWMGTLKGLWQLVSDVTAFISTAFQVAFEDIIFAVEKTWLKIKSFFQDIKFYFQNIMLSPQEYAMKDIERQMAGGNGADQQLATLTKGHQEKILALTRQGNSLANSVANNWGGKKNEFVLPGDSGVNATNIKGKNKNKLTGTTDKEVAKGITSGGPRVINISIGKMVEKLEIHASNIADGMDGMEKKVQEVFLRILNSGASVQ